MRLRIVAYRVVLCRLGYLVVENHVEFVRTPDVRSIHYSEVLVFPHSSLVDLDL